MHCESLDGQKVSPSVVGFLATEKKVSDHQQVSSQKGGRYIINMNATSALVY